MALVVQEVFGFWIRPYPRALSTRQSPFSYKIFLLYCVICLFTGKFDEESNGNGHMTHGWSPDRHSGASTSVRSKFLRYCVICLFIGKFDEESNGNGRMTHGWSPDRPSGASTSVKS